jgi:F-type H+-transporting ATPase subunit b
MADATLHGSELVADNLAHAASATPLEAAPIREGDGLHDNVHAGTEAHGGAAHAPSPTAFFLDSTGWVALAAIVVIVLLVSRKVPAMIAGALDGRIAAIRSQLDEAKRLRAEAEGLRAEYEARAKAADAEAAAMRAGAETEAAAIVEKAKADAAALMARRAAMAEGKIAAAERAAIAEVRAKAAEAATAAAARIIATRHDAAADRPLVDRTIAGLGRLN